MRKFLWRFLRGGLLFLLAGCAFLGVSIYMFVADITKHRPLFLALGIILILIYLIMLIWGKTHFVTAREAKNANVEYEQAEKYYHVNGVKADKFKAKRLFYKAARHSSTDAMYKVYEYYGDYRFIDAAALMGHAEAKRVRDKKIVADREAEKNYKPSVSSQSTDTSASPTQEERTTVDPKLEEERNTFYHSETKISVRYYNGHEGFLGLKVYDADCDVTFYYKNDYGQTKTRSTTIKFSNVQFNSVSVKDCEYRCSSYLGKY